MKITSLLLLMGWIMLISAKYILFLICFILYSIIEIIMLIKENNMRKKRISGLKFMAICGVTITSAYLAADLTGLLADLFDFQEIIALKESIEGITALIIALIWSSVFFHYNILYEEISKLLVTTTSDEKFLAGRTSRFLSSFSAAGVILLYILALRVHLYRNVDNTTIIISTLLLSTVFMLISFAFGIIKLFLKDKEKVKNIDSKENHIMIPIIIFTMLELIYFVKNSFVE